MISRALLNAPFFIPKDADLLRNRKVNTKKRQNRHLPELAFLILGTYFTAPFSMKQENMDTVTVRPIFHQSGSPCVQDEEAVPESLQKAQQRVCW